MCRLRLKCGGTPAKTRFRLSAKRTNSFKSVGVSVQSNTGSRGVHISGSNAGYNMFCGSVKSTGYPLHSPVSPSLPLPCVTACHHISTGLYLTAASVIRVDEKVLWTDLPSEKSIRNEGVGIFITHFVAFFHVQRFLRSIPLVVPPLLQPIGYRPLEKIRLR